MPLDDGPQERLGAVVVFEGSRAACAEAALVLEAKSLPYELAPLAGRWALLTAAPQSAAALDELARYAVERHGVHPRPPAIVTFPGAGLGTALFILVLLITAYCTGIQAFGADWLASGSLDARVGTQEWWRAITALTLHLDQAHLLGNLLFGAIFGTLAGGAFGPGIAWASILAAGACANYLETLISPPEHRAVGASTAVFAALGLLTGFSWRLRLTLAEQFRYRWGPLFAGVFLLAMLGTGGDSGNGTGAAAEHIDVLGHGLGFAMGIGVGWTYARLGLPRKRRRGPQVIAGVAALAAVGVAWFLALRR
ncbi:MAG TPA: rhomboid family intramembrane serine protease [Steroidobacteraceae bacterium]|jgi:membrane associated rhomboid family serine protease|nr:rhomboid family intramembrane serine protease [Steroidobacteraceae bacterium]